MSCVEAGSEIPGRKLGENCHFARQPVSARMYYKLPHTAVSSHTLTSSKATQTQTLTKRIRRENDEKDHHIIGHSRRHFGSDCRACRYRQRPQIILWPD